MIMVRWLEMYQSVHFDGLETHGKSHDNTVERGVRLLASDMDNTLRHGADKTFHAAGRSP